MHPLSRQSRFMFRMLAAVAMVAVSGCLNVPDAPKGLTALAAVSGNHQTIPLGASTTQPLVVRAYDETAAPMAGVTIVWAIAQGSGSLSVATSTTDVNGEASTVYTPGSVAGTVYVTSTANQALQIFFTEQVVPNS